MPRFGPVFAAAPLGRNTPAWSGSGFGLGHHLDLQHLHPAFAQTPRISSFNRSSTRPTSTPRRYFGQNTSWYFAENTVLFVARYRTISGCRRARTPATTAAPRGRLDPRPKPRACGSHPVSCSSVADATGCSHWSNRLTANNSRSGGHADAGTRSGFQRRVRPRAVDQCACGSRFGRELVPHERCRLEGVPRRLVESGRLEVERPYQSKRS